MAIRRRKNKPKPYEVYWRNPYTEKQEARQFSTLREAREYNSLILHNLKYEPEYFKSEEEEAVAGSVSDIISLYLHDSDISPQNLVPTLHHLKTVIAFFGKKQVNELTPKDIIKYRSEQKRKGYATTTIYRRLSILRAALSWATSQELIESNPLAGIKVPKGKNEKIAPPTEKELSAILMHALPHLKRAILLTVYLGVRVGESELFALKWEDVDFERGLIRVWSADKNPNMPYRDLPLRDDLLKLLKVWHEQDEDKAETIVNYNSKPIKSIKRSWATAKDKAGIKRRLRPYDLRHAFATRAIDAGADLKAVAEMMNHSDPSMILKHYHHTKEATKRAIIDSLPSLPRMTCSYDLENKD